MTAVLDCLRQAARKKRRSVVFPETSDPRVLQAATEFVEQKLGIALLVDPPPEMELLAGIGRNPAADPMGPEMPGAWAIGYRAYSALRDVARAADRQVAAVTAPKSSPVSKPNIEPLSTAGWTKIT